MYVNVIENINMYINVIENIIYCLVKTINYATSSINLLSSNNRTQQYFYSVLDMYRSYYH